MSNTLFLIYQRLFDEGLGTYHRQLFYQIDLNQRMFGVVGARGVGKTTLLLQLIRDKIGCDKAFYFSADHIFFTEVSLYHFVEKLVLNDGISTIVIDEVHAYENWAQELKNLYDAFPQLNIIFSGSSALDLVKGSHDLSRRAILYRLPGLSFREYLLLTEGLTSLAPIPWSTLINNPAEYNQLLTSIPGLQGLFRQYLQHGYYPFYHESDLSYCQKLLNVVDKTIYEDIANYYSLNTSSLLKMKRILRFLVTIPPGTSSIHNIAKHLKVDDKSVIHYLNLMDQVGLIHQVFAAEPGNAQLRRPSKIFISNTSLNYAIAEGVASTIDIGAMRELFVIQSLVAAGEEVYYSKLGDYQIGSVIVEIGGKNKGAKQIQGQKQAFLIKDDVLLARGNTIPLVLLGFVY